MTDERRADKRLSVNFPVTWEGESGSHEARLEDISLGGCFVNTTSRVDIGELVTVQIKLPDGELVTLGGEVTSFQLGFGFGMEFTFLTDDDELLLKQLVE